MDKKSKNEQPSILLVEDAEDISVMLKFLLSRQGYTILHAKDGMEAQEMIGSMNRPSVVVLDMILPYVNGLQLLADIRNKISWQNVPVVMVTSNGTTRDIIKAFELGANDYIVKPYRPMELVMRVKRFAVSSPNTEL